MSSIKRKAVTDERPSKKARPTQTDLQSRTAPKVGKPTSESGPSKPAVEDGERKPVKKSLLQTEERAFPRGGASILTPIEQKQIKLQAEQDVLFEQSGQKRTCGKENDGLDTEIEDAEFAATRKKRKTKRGNFSDEAMKRDGPKIQGLSYKNLAAGSLVLGQVTAITTRDVALALPNNLTGYVPLTAVSEKLNGRIETLLDEDDIEQEEDDGDIELKELFHIGQYLRASVASTASESNKRHIELSVDPRRANAGLLSSDVVSDSSVQASIRSVEDHGLIMDLGLEDASIKGFVSKKELGVGRELDKLQEGQVFLCLVKNISSNGKVVNLSLDESKFSATPPPSNIKVKGAFIAEAPTVDAFLPGTAVEVLVTEAGAFGLTGEVMGMLDVTADVIQSGAGGRVHDMAAKYKVGSRVKARVTCTFPNDEHKKIGISLLDHLVQMALKPKQTKRQIPLSSTIYEAKVTHVQTDRGLFLDLGDGELGYAHVSQISDSHIDSLSSTTGPYKDDSVHKARIVSYNPIDGLYYVTLKDSALSQHFLRVEDVIVGEAVKGTVERLILGAKGITGVLVKLAEGITGLVPEVHLSDVKLSHPEKKFREGFPVKARVLSVDTDNRHIRLTLKKTLLGDQTPIWKQYEKLSAGDESQGTIVSMSGKGAVVQFYGPVRAWLPVAEMSESFIERPEQHFRLGQTVKVHVVSVKPETQEMKVSCKDATAFGDEQQEAWDKVKGGDAVVGTVTEVNGERVMIDLDSSLRGVLRVGHLADGSHPKAESAIKRIRVGQRLQHLVVLHKLDRNRQVVLTSKPSFVEAAKMGTLVLNTASVSEGQKVTGFVRNVTPEGVYVEFGDQTVGLLPKTQLAPEMSGQPAFGLTKDQSVATWVSSVDSMRQRFTLSMREQAEPTTTKTVSSHSPTSAHTGIINPVDGISNFLSDFSMGKRTKAEVVAVKGTQINVKLADNVQGRVDVSEIFDNWEQMEHKKQPLQKFQRGQTLDVKILGIHDARNHRFLPISHRQGRVPVFELTAKTEDVGKNDYDVLSLDKIQVGSQWTAFINNHGDDCVWVNLSPNVRGRVAMMNLSDDVAQLQNLNKHFPVGSALRVRVKVVDLAAGRLDLAVAQNGADSAPVTLQNLSKGMVLPARVTKVNERSVTVQLGDSLAGPVPLVELSDDYNNANPANYNKNDIVRVCVINIDAPNKRVFLSLRPSKVLSSSLPVVDPQVTSIAQLKVGDLLRGFIKHVGDNGVTVSLGASVDGFVWVRDITDEYIKDWKTAVATDRLVTARVMTADAGSNHLLLSLKASHVDPNFKAPVTIKDLEAGMVVTGKVRKVEDFGAFIDIDDTSPRLSGLCHRSEVAAKRVEDVRKLYSEGDVVKAVVLSVDVEKRKISLGLKASYFADADAVEEDDDQTEEEVDDKDGVELGAEIDEEEIDDGGVDLGDVQNLALDDGEAESSADGMDVDDNEPVRPPNGLKTNGFDWTGDSLNPQTNGAVSDSEPDTAPTKKRKRKPEIKVDMTGDLDAHGPRSNSDFERQLLGQPNNAALWMRYMAFQITLGETQATRDLGERALRTIHIRETDEKRMIWIALMNLELAYGSDESLDEVFKRACQVQDPLDMHNRLATIFIEAGKHDKADLHFEAMIGNKSFRASPDVWLNYATFLMDTLNAPPRARALLPRALQSIEPDQHRPLTSKFAALEFHSPNGDTERARTIFEGLLSEWPKWSSGWDMWVDLERGRIKADSDEASRQEARSKVRTLHERIAGGKMKKRRAKFVFKRWLEFEMDGGGEKQVERVKALAKNYVEGMQEEVGRKVMSDQSIAIYGR